MSLTIEQFNEMPFEEARQAVFKCCSSHQWAQKLIEMRPFKSFDKLWQTGDDIWFALETKDWLEAFSHHPRIGENVDELRKKFASTQNWSSAEQKGMQSASEETLLALKKGNEDYHKKFGFVFLICATGKGADEMLKALESRLGHDRTEELKIAAGEQSKITKIRLKKLFEGVAA